MVEKYFHNLITNFPNYAHVYLKLFFIFKLNYVLLYNQIHIETISELFEAFFLI